MNCNQCGAEVPAQAAFCPKCGAQLGRVGAAQSDLPAGSRPRPVSPPAAANDVTEQELWSGGYSPRAMAGAFIAAALLIIVAMVAASYAGPVGWIAVAIGAILIFGYLAAVMFYRKMSVQYRLTNQRLIRELGILSRTDDRILVAYIDDVTVHQGVVERMFNLGTIVLVTKDESTKDEDKKYEESRREDEGRFIMRGIEDPRHVADLIDESRRAERTRRGTYFLQA